LALIDDVKLALRINGTASNTEAADLIAAAKADLLLSGVTVTDETNALIKRAIIVYCKAQFGYDNPEADRFQQSYDMLKTHLALSQDYSAFAVTFSVKVGGVNVDEAEVTFNGVTKKTGTAGTVVFCIDAGLNYEYTVTKAGYVPQEANIDISAATTINIVLVAA
jgi:hypothetical protein